MNPTKVRRSLRLAYTGRENHREKEKKCVRENRKKKATEVMKPQGTLPWSRFKRTKQETPQDYRPRTMSRTKLTSDMKGQGYNRI